MSRYSLQSQRQAKHLNGYNVKHTLSMKVMHNKFTYPFPYNKLKVIIRKRGFFIVNYPNIQTFSF